MLLQSEFHRYVESLHEPEAINPSDGVSDSHVTMDPELYDEIRERAERGESIEFNLPDDSHVPRLSNRDYAEDEDEIAVDPASVFENVSGGDQHGS